MVSLQESNQSLSNGSNKTAGTHIHLQGLKTDGTEFFHDIVDCITIKPTDIALI